MRSLVIAMIDLTSLLITVLSATSLARLMVLRVCVVQFMLAPMTILTLRSNVWWRCSMQKTIEHIYGASMLSQVA
jgi:hypothetical protein